MDGVANLKAALDAQPLQRRDVLERAAPRDLINVARIAHAMLFGQIEEERLGLVHHDAGCATRLRVGEASLFEDRDVDAGSREHVRGRASERSAANDGDLGLQSRRDAAGRTADGMTESGRASNWSRNGFWPKRNHSSR